MTFYLWIVLMSQAAVNRLVAELVREDFKVGPLAGSGKLEWSGELSCFLALLLEKKVTPTGNETPQGTVLNLVKKVIEKNQLMHHGCIVHQLNGNSTWNGSNITLPKPKKDEPQTALERVAASKEEEIG